MRNLASQKDTCRSFPTLWRKCGSILAVVFLAFLFGCASLKTSTSYKPTNINDVRFRDRAQVSSDSEVRVTVAVPTAEETELLFQSNLQKREIQPVWIKVENHSENTYYLIVASVDHNYFSPLEAVYSVRSGLFGVYRDEMERYFRYMSFKNPITPHTAVSGFIFTNLDEGEKFVQVDIIAEKRFKSFSFFVPIPGMRIDRLLVDFNSLYSEEEIVDLDKAELRSVLENLPCCTTNEQETLLGDPANLVIIGDFQDIAAAFSRRGWLPAEETYANAVWKTIKSYLFGSRYRYSPVSPLYYFGRHQDFARQKPRHDIHRRNHLRLWYTPMRYQGKPVFVGQISRDIGVRFTLKARPPVTHKIDPDIDAARNALIEDLLVSQMLANVGFVKGVGEARPSQPRTNLTGDPYFTDGYRVVLALEQGPISLDQVETMNWERPEAFNFITRPPDKQIKFDQRKSSGVNP